MIRILKTEIIPGMLILMWSYAAASKLLDFETSRSQMLNQVFPHFIGNILVWAVPLAELITAGLLLFIKTRTAGFYVSLILLLQFTIYISLLMLNVFGRIPCSCGGILEKMSWGQHLVFNLVFILLTLIALVFTSKERRLMGKVS
jgi:putative oxidoreductase